MRGMHEDGVVKTRENPILLPIVTHAAWSRENIMSPLLTFWSRWMQPTTAPVPASPAADLFESADAMAGLDPHHAQELREAASAWLRVVR